MVDNVTGPPVTAENLFGREHEMRSLWNRLDVGQHILLLAPRRVGKTSLMHELRRQPKDEWAVFYSDVERCDKPADLVADMLALISTDRRTRTWFDAAAPYVPFRHQIARILGRIKTFSIIEQLKVELSDEISSDWRSAAAQLHQRLASTPKGVKVLFIQDELPIFLNTLFKSSSGREDVEAILGWLRSLRQDPKLTGRIQFLAGGSISLSGVLRRHNLSAPINDFSLFSVAPWDEETANKFLDALAARYDFALSTSNKQQMLGLLKEYVPYHVQLIFQAVREVCREDASKVSEETIEAAFHERLAGPSGGPFLDHYSERLDHVFSPEDAARARLILSAASASPSGVALSNLNASEANFSDILQVLIDDGYLRLEGEQLSFCSNLVRTYWLRTRVSKNA